MKYSKEYQEYIKGVTDTFINKQSIPDYENFLIPPYRKIDGEYIFDVKIDNEYNLIEFYIIDVAPDTFDEYHKKTYPQDVISAFRELKTYCATKWLQNKMLTYDDWLKIFSKKNNISKFLSLVLRHKPETINIKLDKNGWVDVDELLEKLKISNNEITLGELKYMVSTNDKQRFIFNEDYTKIRANQGHTVDVDLQLKNEQPPQYLYHGTAETNKDSIIKNGINKGKRHHVHLSTDINTAFTVGSRHGKAITFRISSKEMFVNGIKFFKSENNVWLTDFVDPKYINFII